ncbi:glycosyltransferase family 4 protein [Alkaliflexus imshenetskii]|uniref:glycosyltransferase family 4 protein n=1 Tax=Alkaliflexus imshenetskii TaxID=286730 RepID=UPI00047D1B63|nr:glycosyltransferase family 4 protein [Alkaliflexus imshenetskii]
MRVLHINKSDVTGGAAVAASRIVNALRTMEVDTSMLVAEKKSTNNWVTSVAESRRGKARLLYNFLYEVAGFIPHEKGRATRFAFSTSRKGFDLSKHHLVKESDIIHLHWFNQGFLSLRGLEKLLLLGKPVVWTLHDMWSFTGGCHYAGSCVGFQIKCGNCPVIRDASAGDLSFIQHNRKREVYQNGKLSLVACSSWLASEAKRATLTENTDITSIPNPIDTDFFKPVPREAARLGLGLPSDKKIILFGAANVTDPRKGMVHLLKAMEKLSERGKSNQIELVMFGKASDQLVAKLPFRVHLMNYITDPNVLVSLYSAADVFVLPSLEDNLPNTVMESLACGTPIVAFRIGGVPEMVTHGINGFLSAPGDATGLADSIDTLLFKCDEQMFRSKAREKVLQHFTPEIVSRKYMALYESLLR